MVLFFEVITFFGVVAFFAWLEFLTLLNDLVSHVNHSHRGWDSLYAARDHKQAKRNLVGINDFFLMSFASFAIAIIADYLFHNAFYIGPYFVSVLYHMPLLYYAVAGFFPFGIVNLCIPILYIRAIMRGDRDLITPLQNVSTIMWLLIAAVMLSMTDWLGYTFIQFQFGNIVWFTAACLIVLGGIRTVKNLRFGQTIMFAPLWFFMLAILSLFLLRLLSSFHVYVDWGFTLVF